MPADPALPAQATFGGRHDAGRPGAARPRAWRATLAVAGRELGALLGSVSGRMALAAFPALQAALAFGPGGFLERDLADLDPFWSFLPWTLLLLAPAAAARSWSEERRLGTAELLFAWPLTPGQAVAGKFLAGWGFCALALLLCAPFALSAAWLGPLDPGVLACGALGALLLSGALVSVAQLASALSDSQAGAALLGLIGGTILVGSASAPVLDALSGAPALAHLARRLSLAVRFDDLSHGLLALRDVAWLGSVGLACLLLTALVLPRRMSA